MPFAINKTDTNLELKNGYLKIKPYGYIAITKTDAEHPHVEEAVLKQWLTLSETEPVVAHAPVLSAQEELSPFEGLTEAELLGQREKASAAKVAEAEAAANEAKAKEEANVDTSVIGADGSVEVTEIATPKARKSAKADKAEAAKTE